MMTIMLIVYGRVGRERKSPKSDAGCLFSHARTPGEITKSETYPGKWINA